MKKFVAIMLLAVLCATVVFGAVAENKKKGMSVTTNMGDVQVTDTFKFVECKKCHNLINMTETTVSGNMSFSYSRAYCPWCHEWVDTFTGISGHEYTYIY